ncbi:MAG TPA: TonB family protein [Gemmatimonadaceae bacterium]|nr:TonB family protein [Gemmatimonadaceae bacterium]
MRTVSITAHSAVMHRLCTMGSVAVLLVLALGPRPLAAQSANPQGTIATFVRDTSGAGISGAEVGIAGTRVHGYTDSDGRLRLGPVAPGSVRLTVRRLGFRATTVDVAVAANGLTPDTVLLAEVAHRLDPILVRGSIHSYSGTMSGFYQRRGEGFGHFFTRAEIEKSNVTRVSDLFRTVPGMRMVSTNTIQNAVRMRGATTCPPLVWLDGTPAASSEYDLDTMDPLSIDGIEIYSGPAEVPVQFKPPMDVVACGAIVIWSRRGERHGTPRFASNPDTLEKLVAALTIYTADQVDAPAHQDTAVHVDPVYPEALFMSGTSGQVVAEFVVDTTGLVSMPTFSAISSTDPEFTMSVRRALERAVYIPAVRQGSKVRQVVEQPFTFVSDSTLAKRRHG